MAMNCQTCGAPMKLEKALYHPITQEIVMAEYSYQCECHPPYIHPLNRAAFEL